MSLSEDGFPYCRLVEIHGRLVGTASRIFVETREAEAELSRQPSGDGHPCTRLAEVFGWLVPIGSEEFRAACEARYALALPGRDERNAWIDRVVRFRCKAAASASTKEREAAAEKLRDALRAAVIREWEWRQRRAPSATGATDE